MKIRQTTITAQSAIGSALEGLAEVQPSLVLIFAAPSFFATTQLSADLAHRFPNAILLGCSTAGEVSQRGVEEDRAVITAVELEHTALRIESTMLEAMADSHAAGCRLATALTQPNLQFVLVLGQGVNIDGGALVDGMTEVLGHAIPVTGGLAGDYGQFRQTWTLGPAGISDRAVVAVGFYGSELLVGHGSFGGWEAFGPARKVTRCAANILQELDGEPALEVYRRYLGDYARQLPSSGLLFPFAILDKTGATGLIRTILGIDEGQGSLILAGGIEEGTYLKLMHASTDSLVDGAEDAAVAAISACRNPGQHLALLVSCVGRKLVMGDRTDEEIEAVASVLGGNTVRTGFYSYGEISPTAPGVSCKLHNQTMTVTTLVERDA